MEELLRVEPLAIIGAACRLPGNVVDMPGFWRLLSSGEDAVTELPPDRCSLERFFSKSAELPGHGYTAAAGVLSSVKEFDPEFFGLSRKEAMDMDPQQRLLLEMTWEAMEAAGLPPSTLRGSQAGVYVGASNMDYTIRGVPEPEALTPYSMTGSSLSVIANRVSYLFDLHGPSMVMDTACSSSLVALHGACQALLRKEIPLAIVGGVNILLSPLPFIGFSRAHMLSPDGRCKVFDASGNGYVRAEGGGVVLIKPLAQARKDNDPVLAVIAGTGVNSDGRTTGLALPNPKAQADLLRSIYDGLGLDKNRLAYVEAHGTGTAAGDPLEASAIGEILGKPLRGARPLHVGSVKSNIGHMEPAAGMAGLLKAILVLQHGKIPPNLHFHTPNPAIDFNGLNLSVPTRLISLPLRGQRPLVGVNSFGFGGTNAHIVLEKAVPARRSRRFSGDKAEAPPLFLSARSEKSLQLQAQALSECLENADETLYRDTAATLACCRDHMRFRAVIPAEGKDPLPKRLWKFGVTGAGKGRDIVEAVGENCKGAFVFSGNGSQWLGMGKELLEKNAVFAETVAEVDGFLSSLRSTSLLDALRSPADHPHSVSHTEESQPLLFAVQAGLARALQARGIAPDAVFGHSVGEITAAWAAGALSLKDACTIIHYRSRLQSRFRDIGHMAVARVSERNAVQLLEVYQGKVEITAINSSDSLTLGGEAQLLAECVKQWRKSGITAKLLDLPYPFHTGYMEEVREEFLEALQDIQPRKPRIPFFSTAGEGGAQNRSLDAEYWWKNMRHPVRFQDAAQTALDHGCRIFLEIGPHPVLTGYLQDCIKRNDMAAAVLTTLHSKGSDAENFDAAWQAAWQKGWTLRPREFIREPFTRQALPPYPWNKEFLWIEESPECRESLTAPRLHPLLGWRMPLAAPAFENLVTLEDYPWLAEHRAGDSTPFPASCFVEMFLAAAGILYPDEKKELERIVLYRPLRLSMENGKRLRLVVDEEDGALRLEGRDYMRNEDWTLHARGRMIPARQVAPPLSLPPFNPDTFGVPADGNTLYSVARQHHLQYGPPFQTVEKAWLRQGQDCLEALARFAVPHPEAARGMLVSPTLVDGAFQTLFLLMHFGNGARPGQAWLPASFERVALFARGTPSFAHSRLSKAGQRSVLADFSLLDDNGKVLMVLSGCRFRRATWLEGARPSAYVMRSVPAPYSDAASPLEGKLDAVCRSAQSVVNLNLPSESEDRDVSPRGLLRFAALKYAHEALLAITGQTPTPDKLTCAGLRTAGYLARNREPWLRQILLRLAQADLARQNGEDWELLRPSHIPSAETLWRTAVGTATGHLPEAVLLSQVTSRIQDLLADNGQSLPLSRNLFVNYLVSSPDLRPFYQGLVQCVSELLHSRRPDQVLRILQTASDSRLLAGQILPLVAGNDCVYEVAEADAAEAKSLDKSLSSTPEARTLHLDLNKPLPNGEGGYHIILAAFSLHYLDNVAEALNNCQALLAPGGVLCLLEHLPTTFTDLTFGALPGWWKESANGAAPASRMHSAKAWIAALEEAGFVEIHEVENRKKDSSPAFLLLARKSGKPLAAPVLCEQPARGPVFLVARERDTASGILATAIHAALKSAGQEASLLHAGDPLAQGNAFDPLVPEHWVVLFKTLAENGPFELVSLLGYDTQDKPTGEDFARIMEYGPATTAAIASAWDALRCRTRLRLVTGGALDAGNSAPVVPSQGALWGFGRVLMNEMQGLETSLLDVHGQNPNPDLIARELLAPNGDREIILAGAARLSPRLVPAKNGKVAAATGNVRLVFDTPGRLQNLYWRKSRLDAPGPGQVRIAVKAVGLNFRDVMWSMGLLPEEALENGFSGPGMGMECSGIIDAVGEGVTGLKAGDAVLAFAPSCFSTYAITSAGAVTRKPENMSFAEAATIPVAFLTAWYSIKHLAAMQPGERVLIHGAGGGVGLAAIQIAAHLGLEVYATAGSEEKHAFLRKFGVRHLFSSRSLAFAQEVLEATRGEGVDAVLNSLAGEAIPAGVSVLRPFGRFLELGKRDFYADSPLRMQPFSNNLSFFGIDVDQLFASRPGLALSLFQELIGLFGEGRLRPLPHTCYSRVQTVDAFQAMQQSSHIGKLVVLMDEAVTGVRPQPVTEHPLRLRKKASYLVTGGTNGFGLATAKRLAERGARHLILMSRSGVKNAEAQAVIDAMRDANVRVSVVRADVANKTSLSRALKTALADNPPLAGVVHAAAVLDDGMIASLDAARIRRVLAPKALGAWNLHLLTKDKPLDFFVLYSSATTSFGNPGQANYVAANSVLESLADLRRREGLPATVIGWGPIADTGMLQRNVKASIMLKNLLGVTSLFSSEALDWLEHCLDRNIPACHYFGLDWQRQSGLGPLASSRFDRLIRLKHAKSDADMQPLERLRSCPPEEGQKLLAEMLRAEIADILCMPPERLAMDAPIADEGMDSLMAMELGLAIDQKFELDGYTVSLTEKITTADIAKILYPVIMGKGAEQGGSGTDLLLIDALSRQHGLNLNDAAKQDLSRSLHGGANEQ